MPSQEGVPVFMSNTWYSAENASDSLDRAAGPSASAGCGEDDVKSFKCPWTVQMILNPSAFSPRAA